MIFRAGFALKIVGSLVNGSSMVTIDPDLSDRVARLLSPGLRTSIGNNAPRAGNNSLPQQGCRLEPQHERVPNTAHSFFVHYGTTGARYEQYWISIAHQMLPG